MTELTLTSFADTPLGTLGKDGRLFDAVLKGPTDKAGCFGFRGDIALKFQVSLADEKRPPDYCVEQVLSRVEAEQTKLPILIGYLHSFAYLKDFVEVLDDKLSAEGTYILFCNNIDLLAKYQVHYRGVNFIILPLDEATVWNETLELLKIEKNDIKKLSTGGKLDAVVDAALKLKVDYPEITYEDGLKVMGSVRNRNANRPV